MVTTPFAPFTTPHGIAIAWTGAVLMAAIVIGRFVRGTGAQRRLDGLLAAGAVLVNAFSIGYFATPPRLGWAQSLPLQLCDLACLLAPIALLWPERCRWARTLMYFWGLGLSSQAFITPTLTEGFPSLRYWQFWLLHLVIVGTAMYDVIARGYRPSLKDLRLALGVSCVWFAVVFALNIVLDKLGVEGANYGYCGDTRPLHPTVIDRLGEWPLRAVGLAVIGAAVMTFWWAVWPVAGWVGRGSLRRCRARGRG